MPAPKYELADICIECQKNHIKTKKEWEVVCKGIPKELYEDGYYPLEKVLDSEVYQQLSLEDKIELQLKNNKILWAEQKLGWTPYNEKRQFYQYYQKDILLCTAKRKAGRLGRRLGKDLPLHVAICD